MLGRLSELSNSIFGDDVRPAHEAMAGLGREYARLLWRRPANAELAGKVAEILQRTTRELSDLVGGP